ncbi:DUF3826 domain-containing protein [Arachidicoccus terrestris]|uniref:DUF3826 domain-containing protein n=1 Tax=Arachidicoccus terrestris TaxID=2875539 RepID=UPI001CC3F3A1|nr:DUF3826 domain-containing protein [Arachidicoccus terrestris]UAY56199.1 DUF3826 domain-containing protein [Arachidicoccus terrestris]
MRSIISKLFLCSVVAGGSLQVVSAQFTNTTAQEDPAYVKVIQGRVAKIVEPLHLKDAAKVQKVSRVIEQQYFDLNRIDSIQVSETGKIKDSQLSETAKKDAVKAVKAEAEQSVARLHPAFVGRLNELLNKDQVDEVKDGLTYHTLEVTYRAYTQMLPDLSQKQKDQIMAWLVEAREHAIDGGSSKEKHWWFGKYKGRINNYLSSAGIDMKEAEIAWKKRRESAKK